MGDLGDTTKKTKELHILVSGAGSFGAHDRNPANLIASGLPSRLAVQNSNINIVVHSTPTPWKVSYSWVREYIPPMLFPPDAEPVANSPSLSQAPNASRPHPNYDMVLFLGMAAGRHYYTLECQASRDGYEHEDVDGKTAKDDKYWANLGAPEILPTSLDTDRVYQSWRENVTREIDVRPSDDAGRYLCDFIYYTGLFEYWLRYGKDLKQDRPVIFLHVPGEAEDSDIERGIFVAEGLIKAMAASLVESRGRDE